jgi:hypothetical protein
MEGGGGHSSTNGQMAALPLLHCYFADNLGDLRELIVTEHIWQSWNLLNVLKVYSFKGFWKKVIGFRFFDPFPVNCNIRMGATLICKAIGKIANIIGGGDRSS